MSANPTTKTVQYKVEMAEIYPETDENEYHKNDDWVNLSSPIETFELAEKFMNNEISSNWWGTPEQVKFQIVCIVTYKTVVTSSQKSDNDNLNEQKEEE